ncbi:uncharacterized protein LOC121800840 [Salvia splendens]|uniref:uncharacterized protein LOC121800840 n=1 Tax=Salvia splendens TaxID=180675 RepID=UPI001C269C53|nr:uncharacterized protein LOC121800840 [Salvia splendens]
MEKLHTYDFCGGDGYDAVVVGSGYGGSVAACRLSMAGFKVCLFEKGRKWEAKDFPSDSFKILSTLRLENKNMGINIGPKDALFQVHIQDDSLAATACGLGGGSLVNAGIILPTTVRARRDPRWPEPWEKYEALVSEMLNVQSVPTVFQNSNIMQQVVDNEYDKSIHEQIKLSINFDVEDSRKFQQPAGCIKRTESEVHYVVRNDDNIYRDKGGFEARSKRRWLVFLNEFDYVASDIVILSAWYSKNTFPVAFERIVNVREAWLGIELQWEQCGLLGWKLSPFKHVWTKRNTVLWSTVSRETRTVHFFIVGVHHSERCDSRCIFKGITTYKWQSSNCFLHVVIDVLKRAVGLKRDQDMWTAHFR